MPMAVIGVPSELCVGRWPQCEGGVPLVRGSKSGGIVDLYGIASDSIEPLPKRTFRNP